MQLTVRTTEKEDLALERICESLDTNKNKAILWMLNNIERIEKENYENKIKADAAENNLRVLLRAIKEKEDAQEHYLKITKELKKQYLPSFCFKP